MDTQLRQGIERVSQIFESRRILKLSDPEPIRGRLAFYFVAKAYEKEWLFSLSHEALSDLPGMKSYQAGADRFARSLEKRFRNKSPDLFFCVSGVPVQIQIEWPLQPLANRAASYPFEAPLKLTSRLLQWPIDYGAVYHSGIAKSCARTSRVTRNPPCGQRTL